MKKILMLFLVLTFFTPLAIFAGSVPKMTVDELKSQLGAENLVVLDVRLGKDWSSSEFKIKSAVRIEGGDLSAATSYPKDKTLVLYCA